MALIWTPSWGLFSMIAIAYMGLMTWTYGFSQAVDGKMIPATSMGELDETDPRDSIALPLAALDLYMCVWLPLCLVTPQPGCVLYALLALSLFPPAILYFLFEWTWSTARAPPPCQDFMLVPAVHLQGESGTNFFIALLFSLPFLLFLIYAHPVTRVPLAFLLPLAGWSGNHWATRLQSEDESREMRAELEAEQKMNRKITAELELERAKCAGLEERAAFAAASALRSASRLRNAEAAAAEAVAARRGAAEANASASAAIEAGAREKLRFAELKREAEVARGVSKAAIEEAAVLRKRGDELERRRDAARTDADAARAEAARLSTEDAARRREVLALQASVDELSARVEHHRTAAGTLRTRNTELKAQLKEQRRLADRAVAAAALLQEAESQGAAAAAAANAAELAAAASQQGSSSHGWLECSICLQDLREASAEERLALPCAHVFHAACVEPWLRTHSECPECKTPVR